MIKQLISIYSEIYSCVLGTKKYELPGSDYNVNLLSNFIDKVKNIFSDVDLDWYRQFILYQFKYYSDKKTRLDGKVYLNWIFGDKAIIRWKNKEENWQYFIQKYKESIGYCYNQNFNIDHIFHINQA